MNIRTRLTLIFSLITASILLGFSIAVYLQSAEYRRDEFYSRLENRALNTANLLVRVKELDRTLLKTIDQNSINAMFDEKLMIFDENNTLVYASLDDLKVPISSNLFDRIRQEGRIKFVENKNEVVGIHFQEAGFNYVIISSAFDKYGRSKLDNLRNVLLVGFCVGIIIIIVGGIVFSGQALQPIVNLNKEVSTITAGNLNRRVDEGKKQDEIDQLAINFNHMLERLEEAFAVQQQFVSSASHELRTPLSAMSLQLQHVLSKERTKDNYRAVLQSIHDDTMGLVTLTNGLLTLAQSDIERQRKQFKLMRIDECIFEAQDELAKTHPLYHFNIDYSQLPEDERALQILANAQLLKTAFLNLMENGCKFSPDKSVEVSIDCGSHGVQIVFSDHGMGISKEDLEKIFLPFYRSANAQQTSGFGIGLALTQRIIELHGGHILVESEVKKGSRFTVIFHLGESAAKELGA